MKLTTVIPAYKSRYLDELLISFAHQTVKLMHFSMDDDTICPEF